MSKRRWLPKILLAGGLTLCIVGALVWWQEQGLESIEQRLAEGDVNGALAAVEAYLVTHPDDERALALRARGLAAAGYAAEADIMFQQVGAAELDDLQAWSAALMSLGQWERAIPILERMAQLDPLQADTLERITVCEFESGNRQGALAAGRRLAALSGFEAAGHLQLASMYTAWGSSLEAIRHYKRVLDFRPAATGLPMPPVEFFAAYARALLQSGNARQALEILAKVAADRPSPEISLLEGQAAQMIGRFKEARTCYQRILDDDPAHRDARQGLAEISLQQGRPEEAVEWLEPLVDQQRLNADGAFLLLRAYTDLNDPPQIETWQAKTEALRLRRRRLRALEAEAAANPSTPRAVTITAYVAAARQDWETAGQLLATLLREMPEAYEVPFVEQLVDAVRNQDTLPPIDSLPQRPAR